MASPSSLIHPTAVVATGAEVHSSVEIGPYCYVGPRVRLGKNTRLLGSVFIDGDTELGENNTVFPFASLGYPPQDRKHKGKDKRSCLLIGDANTIRENVTINAGTDHGGGVTRVGHRNQFMAYSHVGHDCHVGDDNTFVNHVSLAGHVYMGNGITLSGYVGVTQHVRIGSYAMIGAGCIASLDIAPFVVGKAKDNNRVSIQAINKIGLERAGFQAAEIEALDEAFRLIFRSSMTLQEAARALRESQTSTSHTSPAVNTMIDFLLSSTKGIAR